MAQSETPQQTISDELFHFLISNAAHTMSVVRKYKELLGDPASLDKYPDSPEDREADWHNGCAFLALKVLNGTIFIHEIDPLSYRHFKQVWLRKIKEVIAYLIWLERQIRHKQGDSESDYFKACEHLRDVLLHSNKLTRHDFKETKDYLERNYLTTDWKLDESKIETKELIGTKACRIWQITGRDDETSNWLHARIYTKMFYENIIPAVIEDDPEKTLSVLKAFQFSEAPENRFRIINCFELLLAVYFLNPSIIRAIWDRSNDHPFPQFATAVEEVSSWPNQFDIPGNCEGLFDVVLSKSIKEKTALRFTGAMSESQRDALTKKLRQEEHKGTIKRLFERSRVLTKNATL
ncbi:MAG: hypothetical protein ABSG91_12675 [Syntrophobacteraceae bacterium]|jgi:hypothetical protein